MPKNIFITGATGFIGAQITEELLSAGHTVMALKRNTSNTWRCKAFEEKIAWVNKEETAWKDEVIAFHPDVIIHTAWAGIDAKERQQWETQFSNINLLLDVLKIAKQATVKKFISLGSQAEYGFLNGRVKELHVPEPDSPYGIAKLAARKTVQVFCEEHKINWYWLIVFSVFGPKEDRKWFIPTVINNLLKENECKLTLCEQKYDYLYIKDLAKMSMQVVENNVAPSGIFNLSSNKSQSLKQIVATASKLIGSSSDIQFGAIPYREGQSMHIEGDSSLFLKTFGNFRYTSAEDALKASIEYYKSHDNESF